MTMESWNVIFKNSFKHVPLHEQLSQLDGVMEHKTGSAEPEKKGSFSLKIILRAMQ